MNTLLKNAATLALCCLEIQTGVLCAASGRNAAFQFLNLNPSARAESLAGTLTATGDDLSSLNINPATLSRLNHSETLFSQGLLFEDVKFSYLAYGQPTRWGTPSLDYLTLQYGQYDRISREGEVLGRQNPNEMALGLGWATNEKNNHHFMDFGGTLRWVRSDLAAAQASALSLNMGLVFKLPIDGLKTGIAVNNLGGSVRYARESYPQPRSIRLGMGYVPREFFTFSSKARFSADAVLNESDKVYFSMGSEFTLFKLLSLQVGFSSRERLENRIYYGLGAGLDAFQFNYCATPMGELGTTHRISARMRFGQGLWNLARLLSKEQRIADDIKTAKTYHEKRVLDRALLYANKALKDDPGNAEALEIIDAIENSQKLEMAAEIYEEAVTLYQSKQLEEAREKIRQAVELNPFNKDYLALSTSIRLENDRNQRFRNAENLKMAQASLERDFLTFKGLGYPSEQELEACIRSLKPLLENGDLESAHREMEHAKILLKSLAAYVRNNGLQIKNTQQQAELSSGRSEKQSAPEAMAKAAKNDGESDEIHVDPSLKHDFERAIHLMHARNVEDAIRLLRNILARDRNHSGAVLKLSECLKSRGITHFVNRNYKESARDFEEALKLNPADPHLKKFLENAIGMQKNTYSKALP